MSSETQRSLPRTIAKLAVNHRGYRKAWPRERFFLRSKRHTPVVAVDTGGARYFVSTSDEAVGLGIFAHGSHEREQLDAVSAVLADWSGEAEPLRGKRFLDIGANIGTSVVEAMVSLGCSGGWALEPHPGNFKLLRHNLLENGLDEKVEALEMAVSETDGTATLEVAKVNMGDHRVRVGDASGGRMAEGERETIDVPMRSLDSLVGDGTVSLDDVALAWVDTQGHEAHVLAGARAWPRRACRSMPSTGRMRWRGLGGSTGSTASSRGLGARSRISDSGTRMRSAGPPARSRPWRRTTTPRTPTPPRICCLLPRSSDRSEP